MAVGTRRGAFVLFKGKLKTCQVFLRLIKSISFKSKTQQKPDLGPPIPLCGGQYVYEWSFRDIEVFLCCHHFQQFLGHQRMK